VALSILMKLGLLDRGLMGGGGPFISRLHLLEARAAVETVEPEGPQADWARAASGGSGGWDASEMRKSS
jgi:hypothetical protein